jgi:tetratricopeptide (TPR) repeat protein
MRPGTEFQDALRQLFADEVRVAARFVHPHIALIYDVSLSWQQPWLAMELASGKSLAMRAGSCTWEQLRDWMGATLQALAYVHARGIIHRDIKPENLLLCSESDPRPGLKVADFGIAWPLGQTRARIIGTPEFWAPEQAAGDARRMGAWTDLYALGRTALYLAGKEDLGRARLESVGAGGWLERLLESDPRDRHRCAADALHELRSLPELSWSYESEAPPLPPAKAQATTFDFGAPEKTPEPLVVRSQPRERFTARAAWPDPFVSPVLPPSALPGVGTSLGRLRERPLLGRAKAQDQLSECLRGLQGGRVVELIGGRGTGTSSLSQWFTQRALETGTAQVLHIGSELLSLFLGLLGAWELEGLALRAQLASVLGWTELEPLLAWLQRQDDAPQGEQLGRLLLKVLATLDPERPWILALDEAPSPALASVLRTMLGEQQALLLLLTRDPSQEGSFPSAQAIRLTPLAHEDLAALLDTTLSLDPWARSALVSRAKGSPRLLLELLWHAVDAGLVTQQQSGFVLDAKALEVLPYDLSEAAEGRLVKAVEPGSDAHKLAQLGSLLAPTFTSAVLLSSGRRAGLGSPSSALAQLMRSSVLIPDEQGRLALATAELRAVLRAQVDELDPESQALLYACAARALERVPGLDARRLRGQLLVASGAGRDANLDLIEVCWEHLKLGRPMNQLMGAAELLEREAERLQDLELRARVVGLQARMAERLGQIAKAAESAERAVLLSRELGDPVVLRRALHISVFLRRQLGRHKEAREAAEESVRLARAHGDLNQVLGSLVEMGWEYFTGGDRERAGACFEEVGRLATTPKLRIEALMGRARSYSDVGQLQEALPLCKEVLVQALKWGSLDMSVRAAIGLGVCQQQLGDLDAAAEAYREVERINRLRGVVQPTSSANLATVEIERGHNAEGIALLEQVLPRAEALSQGPLVQAVHCFALAGYAGLGQWEAVDRTLDALEVARHNTGFRERGLARFLDMAGERLESAGQDLQAIAAWREAQHMWRALKRDDRVALAQAAIDRLSA